MYLLRSYCAFWLIAAALTFSTHNAIAAPPKGQRVGPVFDTRITGKRPVLEPARAAALQKARAQNPDLRVDLDEVTVSPKWVRSTRGFLTGPKADPRVLALRAPAAGLAIAAKEEDPHEPAKRFLDEHAALFGHGSEMLANAKITRQFVSDKAGMRTVVWQQEVDGISVYQGVLIAHIAKDGALINISSLCVPRPGESTGFDNVQRAALAARPPISALQSVVTAAISVGEEIGANDLRPLDDAPRNMEHLQRFTAQRLNGEIRAHLVWLPTGRQSLRLCWQVDLTSREKHETYRTLVDAQTGEVLVRRSLTVSAESFTYNVFRSDSPSPFSPGHSVPNTSQPSYVVRSEAAWTAFVPEASPNGWINAGENKTVGNNVDAHIDWANSDWYYREWDDEADDIRAWTTSDHTFDHPMTLPNDDPENYRQASVVQLFYWCNWMHDSLYRLGFNEAAGNFQFVNEFDGVNRGGTAGDPVLADAQDNSWYAEYNNAQMTVYPEDGYSPRLEMMLFYSSGMEYRRDSALDAEVVLHEYTHGLSNRRVGGGVGLALAGGLGEGWSDFMSLALLAQQNDNLAGNYACGGYSTYLFGGETENYYYGIRRYPYSTDLTKNPLTFKDIDEVQADPHNGIPRNSIIGSSAWEVHNMGEVWCSALWEARARLLQGRQGDELQYKTWNDLMLQLVVDGMNLAPPDPTFIQARDAIFQAALLHGVQPSDISRLWEGFAKRGLGYSAADAGYIVQCPSPFFCYALPVGVVEAFDMPTPGGELWSFNAGAGVYSSPALGVDGTIYFGNSAGTVFALNPDGSVKWQFSTAGIVYSSPAIGPDGCVYVVCASGQVYCLNPDGTQKWSFTSGGLGSYSSPAIGADGTIYFGCKDNKLYALNKDGSLKWTFLTGGMIYSSPSVDNAGVIYFCSLDRNLYAVNPNGTLRWSAIVGDYLFSSPTIDPNSGRILVCAYYGKICAFSAADGQLVWYYQTGGSIMSSPVLDREGNVFVGSHDNNIYSLFANGELRWSYATSGDVLSSPAVGWDNRVFVGSYDHKLYVIGNDGTLIKSFQTGGGLFSSPTLGSDGRLYIGGLDYKVYAFPAETQPAPSAWPMFRRDSRHFANTGFMQMDGGELTEGAFRINIHSSVFAYPFTAKLEWSDDLITWHYPRTFRFYDGGFNSFADAFPLEHDVFFYRVKATAGDYPRASNPYGFVKLTIPPGDSMISNPLNTKANTLNGLMPVVPDGIMFHKFNASNQEWESHTFFTGFGWLPDATLLPGEGGLIQNYLSEPFTVTFIGEVLQGYLTKPVPAGWSIRSSMVPQGGGITTLLGFGPDDGLAAGDKLYRLDNLWGSYLVYTYDGTAWYRTTPTPSILREPTPAVGEAFWIESLGARNWTRTFSVWP